MKNTKKIIACLYAGIVATSAAQTITFNGTNTIQGHDYLKFELSSAIYGIQIDKVEVDDNALRQWLQQHNMDNVEVNLVIPGETQGKQTYIGERAFKLSSNLLKINIKFEKTEVNKVLPVYVQFPKKCCWMFSGSRSITEIDFAGANTFAIEDTKYMFEFCRNLRRINFGPFNAWNVEDMSSMFKECESLTELDLSGLKPSKVKNMEGMFEDCKSLTRVNLSNFNTHNVENMERMFANCRSLQNLDLSHFDMREVFNMGYMFCNCANLNNLSLPPATKRKDRTERLYMFAGCGNLQHIQGFTIRSRDFMTTGMFMRCPAGAQFNFPTN